MAQASAVKITRFRTHVIGCNAEAATVFSTIAARGEEPTAKGLGQAPVQASGVESEEMAMLVEYACALVIRCVVLFYLGDLEQAMTFVPELVSLCALLPAWCNY